MGDRYRKAGLVGEALQFPLPQFDPGTVAATTVRGDRQAGGVWIARVAKLLPPAPDALDREGRGVGIDADADPSMIGSDVIDAIGGHLAELGDLEVMHTHRLGLALRTQFAAGVLEVADKFLL